MKTKIITLLAAVTLLAACTRNRYEPINNADSNTADTASYSAEADSAAVARSPKLVKTADLTFKVKSVQQTGDSISGLTKRYHGMVMHHRMASEAVNSQDIRQTNDSILRVSAFRTTADMTVKIPSEHLEEFMRNASHLGLYVTSRQMDIEDRSFDYLEAQMKLQARREMVAQQKTGKIRIKDPAAVLYLKDDMVDGQIQNQRINDAVRYSVVSLSFYESNSIIRERIVNDDPSAYQLPFFKRLGLALSNGWFLFVDLLIGLANLWVLLPIAVAIWFVYKALKRKTVVAA